MKPPTLVAALLLLLGPRLDQPPTFNEALEFDGGRAEVTAGFEAEFKLLENLKVGDKVNFDLTVNGNAGEVTAIKKQ